MALILSSRAFADGAPIPVRYTGDGADCSPPLAWTGQPDGTRSLALIVQDPDAPGPQVWVHWLIWNIPTTAQGLEESVPRREHPGNPRQHLCQAVQGRNSWQSDNRGYRGPAPPRGHSIHHYHFHLYALDKVLTLPPGSGLELLLAAMSGHILAESLLVGTYER